MERPQALTSLGILNIAIGISGFLGSAAVLLDARALSANPAIAAMRESPEYLSWSRIQAPIGLVLSVVLLAAGIGLLYLKPWARMASLVCAIFMIMASCIASFVYLKFALPVVLGKAAHATGPDRLILTASAYAGAGSGVFGLIYPSILLYFLTRPHVKAALGEPAWPPPPSG